jgi:hypothetical protein
MFDWLKEPASIGEVIFLIIVSGIVHAILEAVWQ